MALSAPAATVGLEPVPSLEAALPAGTTYEVEYKTGNSWAPSGVLIAGNGYSNLVRLHGSPQATAYRLAQVGGTNTVTPAVTFGLGLAAQGTEPTGVAFQTAPRLTHSNSWTHLACSTPDANGRCVARLPEPLSTQAFFRSKTPSGLALADVVPYSSPYLTNGGAAGYSSIPYAEQPQLLHDGYVVAPCSQFYNRGGQFAAAAGECYEFAGPAGNVTVLVSDFNDSPPAGACSSQRPFFDMGSPAYDAMTANGSGSCLSTYRLVPAPVTGNVKMTLTSALNLMDNCYMVLLVYNHRAGVSKLEIRGPASGSTGGNWTELPRDRFNQFTFLDPNFIPAGFPLDVRVTSRFGEVVTFPPITSMYQGEPYTANSQFAVFPSLDPVPVYVPQPVYTDGLTTNFLGAQWFLQSWGALAANSAHTAAAYTGSASLLLSNINAYAGLAIITSQYQPSTNAWLEFAAKSATVSTVTNLCMSFDGIQSASGGTATSLTIALPAIGDSWRLFRIPLQPAQAPRFISQIIFLNASSGSAPPVLLDAMSFLQP
ncbi:MAG TPA: hypothetical protein PKI20_20945 [Verrucomicrobiota bacterium]|jgi:expansin (peptidoglycan-binding protein)|nr:hypothetical protein [Verrucomicrobiota bacterium]HQL80238.1 hypothetical protein [Verrucomicrobiota bacterium]